MPVRIHSSLPPRSKFSDVIKNILTNEPRKAQRLLKATPGLALERSSVIIYFKKYRRYLGQGDTALHLASALYRLEIVRSLLKAGADPRAANRLGARPLDLVSEGQPGQPGWDPVAQCRTIKTLITAGAEVDALNKFGVTSLHRAVRTRAAMAVKVLLELGADPRRRNKASGSTPLHLAVQTTGRGGSGTPRAKEGQLMIVRVLLARGALVTDKDHRGQTVLQRASKSWIQSELVKG